MTAERSFGIQQRSGTQWLSWLVLLYYVWTVLCCETEQVEKLNLDQIEDIVVHKTCRMTHIIYHRLFQRVVPMCACVLCTLSGSDGGELTDQDTCRRVTSVNSQCPCVLQCRDWPLVRESKVSSNLACWDKNLHTHFHHQCSMTVAHCLKSADEAPFFIYLGWIHQHRSPY